MRDAVALTDALRLFRSYDEVEIKDMALGDYLAVKQKHKYMQFLPHSAGRFSGKRFRKAHCPIVERLVNSLMMHGRNNGKKMMAVRIVKHVRSDFACVCDAAMLTVRAGL